MQRYPDQRATAAELLRLTDEWVEDLDAESISAVEFVAAAKIVRRRCRWWPRLADVVEAVAEIRAEASRYPSSQSIPWNGEGKLVEDPDEIALRSDVIRRIIAGEITWQEGMKEQETITSSSSQSSRHGAEERPAQGSNALVNLLGGVAKAGTQ